MEEKKYYVIKVDNFYLRDFHLNEDNINTYFVRGVEFTTVKENSYTFNTIDDAHMMLELLVKLGFVSTNVYEL